MIVSPLGRFWTPLTPPVIDYSSAACHFPAIGAFAVHKRAVLFEDYVGHFSGLLLEYKAAGNQAFELMAKLLVNALFGKYGQSGRKWVETDVYDWPSNWDYGAEGFIEDSDGKLIKLRYRLGRIQQLLTEGE